MKQEDFTKLQELYRRKAELEQELEKFQNNITVCFVDIVGSSRYFDLHGDVAGMIYVHNCIDTLIPQAEKHGGTVCKTIGDALMTSYQDPAEAVRAAVDMQSAIEAYNQGKPEAQQFKVRIGLNFGTGLVKEKDVFGDVVNVAARIEAAAKGEQIFISATLAEQVRAANFPLQKLPELAAKGKERPVAVYEVLWKKDKSGKPVSAVKTPSPTMAGRTPVLEAAKLAGSGTLMLSSTAIAEMLKKPAVLYALMVVRPDGTTGQGFRIDRQVSVLGRVEGDIVFPDDPLVSRRHAQFTITTDGLMVEDLKSANGVYRRLREPQTLANGDILLMGRQMFRFHAPSATATLDGAAGKEKEKSGKVKEAKADSKEVKAATAAAAVPELIRLLAGGVEENHYPLPPGEHLVGRTRGTINFPDDAYLSGQHARIKNEGGKCTLEDLQAVNGTFVGVRNKVVLTDGDIILIGHQLLRVTSAAS